MNKVFNPCVAQVGVTLADMSKKTKKRSPEQNCGEEGSRVNTPGTKDGKRYCEFHYNFLKENLKK